MKSIGLKCELSIMGEFYLPGPCPPPVFSKWLVNEGKGEEINKQGTNDPSCIHMELFSRSLGGALWHFSSGVFL